MPDASEPESKIADVVHQLLRDRSLDRAFGPEDNLRDVGLTSLDMTSLVFAVEAEFAIQIPTARSRRQTSPRSRPLRAWSAP